MLLNEEVQFVVCSIATRLCLSDFPACVQAYTQALSDLFASLN